MADLISYGEFAALGDLTTAFVIRESGSNTQKAVDDRVKPALNQALLDNPTVGAALSAAATTAAASAVLDAGMVIGQPVTNIATTNALDVSMGWTQKVLSDPYSDTYTDTYVGTWNNTSQVKGSVPVLDSSGRVRAAQLPANVMTSDGSTAAVAVNIGESVQLREVQGARGARLEFKSRKYGADYRPYMEVNAADWDLYGDVTAGYQIHVRGNGSTPNTGSRVYWFVEAHGLGYTQNGDPKYEGWYGMGVANRANGETPDGMGRAFLIGGGGRGALGFPFAQPYVELMKNTAFMADDRARPAWGNGVGQNHVPQTPGTLHSGDLINMRREGSLGIRLASFSDQPAESAVIFMGRSRGTVITPGEVQAGDTLGKAQFGTQTTVSPDYVHIPNNGTDPRNQKVVSAEVRSVATEAWTAGTKQGSQVELTATPNAKTTPEVVLAASEPGAAGDTSILIRVNKAGVVSQTRVEVGAPDSGGSGYRTLRIPN